MIVKIKKIALLLVVCFLVFNIVLYPQQVFYAAKNGVNTWFNIVFPALLPFFIGAELLIELGVIRFIGVLLEPVVRPIFNVPGAGSFVFAMSLTSGYPIGVKLTSELRKREVFTKVEAQRLLSFCSTSGPLFMIGAVAIGMFHNTHLGIFIAVSHYIGSVVTGICFRFYKAQPAVKNNTNSARHNYIKKAFLELWSSMLHNDKPFGSILGIAVKKSVETLLVIGGFIILFSVIIQLLTLTGFIGYVAHVIRLLNIVPYFDLSIMQAIISGIFEITIGCKLLSEISYLTFSQQAIFCTFIISWSGFSIHAQSASFINGTDLSVTIYLLSKLLHSFFSVGAALILLPFSHKFLPELETPAFLDKTSLYDLPSWLDKVVFSTQIFLTIILFSIFAALVSQVLINWHKK